MKRTLSILLSLLLLLGLVPVSRANATTAEGLTYEIENGQVTITGYKDYDATGELIIPYEIEGYPVTSIEARAFSNGWGDYQFSSVVIPDTVDFIGEAAFSGCKKLTKVTLPQLLLYISAATFFECTALSEVTIPKYVRSIHYAAFNECTSLKTITFTGKAPGMDESEEALLFGNVTATVYYPAGDSSWTEEVRRNYSGTLTWVSVCTEHVPGDWVVKWEPTTTSTGRQVRYCTLCGEQVAQESIPRLTWVTGTYGPFTYELYSNNTVKILSCNPLVEGKLVIPDTIADGTVVSIDVEAFMDCDALTSVVLPAGLKNIGQKAFYSCGKLTHVTIPAGVTSISGQAFAYCSNLDTVEFLGSAPSFSWGDPDNNLGPPDPGVWDEDYVYDPDAVVSNSAFAYTNATGYYPAEDPSWADTGKLGASMPKWKASCGSHTPSQWSTLTEGTETTQSLEGQRCTDCGALLDAKWVTPSSQTVTGTANDGITWKLDRLTGLLTVSGQGEITAGYWYSYASEIQSVHIEDGITGIGRYAFLNLSNLKHISIPDTVTAIAGDAFEGCDSLVYNIQEQNYDVNATALYLGNAENPWHALVELRADDFVGDQRPAGMKYNFEFRIHEDCKMVASYVDHVSPRAAYYVYLERVRIYVDLPEGLTTIGDYAFATDTKEFEEFSNGYEFSLLSSIHLPDSLTTIGDFAFIHCTKLTELNIPGTVTDIGEGAFHHCGVKKITLPETMTEIPDWLLAGCDQLTEITLPSGITRIGDSAFTNCFTLTSIRIPAGVTELGSCAFDYCQELKTVFFDGAAPEFGENAFGGVTATVYYPANASGWTEEVRQNYGGTLTWQPVCDTHTPGDWVIAKDVTAEAEGLKEQHCAVCGEVMASETIPQSVSGKCGPQLLWNLDLVTGLLTLSGTGEMYPNNAAPWKSYQEYIKTLVVEEGALSIADCAFQKLPNLTSVTLPQSLTSIGSYAFFECGSLTTVVLPDELEKMGNWVFAYTGLTEVTVPRGMTTIPTNLFNCCSALTSVTLPNDLTVLPEGTFFGCSSLTSVALPQGITEIGIRAFYKCYALKELTIPAKVASVGTYAFYKCEPDALTFTGNAPEFAADAFQNAVTTVRYPGNDASWTGKTNAYGGTITWEPWYPVLPVLSPKYPTVSFAEEVIMNVYFDAQNLDDVAQMGLITFRDPVDDYSIENADHVLPGYAYSETEQLYWAQTQGIPAAQMNQTIYFAVYAQLNDGSYAYSSLLSYSPTTYAYNQLKNESMRTLVVAMLNYGAAAQTYFGTNTDNLMNSSLTQEQKSLAENYRSDMITPVTKVAADRQGSFAKTTGFGKGYPSVNFEGIFSINYYVMPEAVPADGVTMYVWDQATVDSGAVLTAQNATDAVAMTDSGDGTWQGMVGDIAASRLDEGVYVAFCYSDGTSDYCSGILPYSIGTYCASQANTGTALAPFAQATAVYGYYAKQMFNA